MSDARTHRLRHRRPPQVIATAMAMAVVLGSAACDSTSVVGREALATLEGRARSVETTSPLADLTSIHLVGSSVLSGITGAVTDRSGRNLGDGTLRASGTDLVLTGAGMTVRGRVRIEPRQVTVDSAVTGGAIAVGMSGVTSITAGTIVFQPSPPPTPSTTRRTRTQAAAPPITLTAPVTVRATSLDVTGTSLRFVDAPTDLRTLAAEADVSWAGSGSITTAAGPLRASYLGVRAQQLTLTAHRSAATVDLEGTGLALQAFADGVPRLRTTARVEVSATRATAGAFDRRPGLVWVPRNLGSTYDMAILRIRPGNAAAAGVHMGLEPMPPMFGGEPHAPVGGVTSGFKGGAAIDSLIARNGDDKRTVGYDAPPGVQLVLIVEGNFDPITVVTTSA